MQINRVWNRRLSLESVKDSVGTRNFSAKNLLILLAICSIAKFLFFVLSAKDFSLPISEAWKDYAYAYVPSVQAFKNGSLPYRDFYYAYPPLFLYALTLFSFIPYFWSMALPLIISDILTVIPIYLICRHFLTERYAFISSVLFALAPINLSYVDYVWLNPPLTTLFLMVSIYLIIKERYDLSAFSLALSIGFKQTSLFVLPILLFYVGKKLSRKGALRYLLIVALICLAFSIPYILVAPRPYLVSVLRLPLVFVGKVPENYFGLPISLPPGQTIETINTSTLDFYGLKMMKLAGLNAPVTLSLPIFLYLLPELPSNTYSMVGLVFTVLLFVTYGLLLYRTYRKEQFSIEGLVRYVSYSLLIFFTLYPIYKYYVTGVTPLLSLFIQNKRNALVFIALNFALLLVPRTLASYVALLALIWILRAT